MPDQFWCLECDQEFTSPAPGDCPHCGNALQNMEGMPESADAEDGPQEYPDEAAGPSDQNDFDEMPKTA